MSVGALLAPLLAEALAPALVGTLGGVALKGALGAGLGAGSGALFGEITGGDPGKGALSGAIGGAAGPLGGALGEAAGIGSTAGAVIGGAAGGAAGQGITGGNPLIGAAEGAAGPAIGSATGISGGSAAPSASVASAAPSTGAGSALSAGGSAGAGTAATTSSIPLDPTGGPNTGGGSVSGASAFGLNTNTYATDPGAAVGADVASEVAGLGGTAPGSNVGGGLDALISKFTSNPTALLAAAPLAMSLFGGGQSAYPAERSLTQLATNAGTEGASLQGYLQSGTLPPGAQANVDAARKGAEASIRSANARLGLSGSSMEAQQLEEAKQQAAGQQFLLANNLLKTGLQATNQSTADYDAVLRAEMSRDAQFNNALASFTRGLAGFGGNLAPGPQPTTPVWGA